MLLKNPLSSLSADSFVCLVSATLVALLLPLAVALVELDVIICVEVVDIDVDDAVECMAALVIGVVNVRNVIVIADAEGPVAIAVAFLGAVDATTALGIMVVDERFVASIAADDVVI